jgi:hypothetical protein
MLRAGQRRKFVRTTSGSGGAGGLGFPSFYLPLNDLGNGIVNTVPALSAGSPVATFTRSSIAWTKLSSGLWAPIGNGIQRSGYLGQDTAVGAYGGYFAEGLGTQLVSPTAAIRDMTNAAWTAVGITPTKTATGIDGVPNACTTLTCTAPGGSILQTLVAAASSRAYSVFLRRVSGNGTIVIQQGATTQDVTAQINTVTKTRVWLNASILNSVFGIVMGTAGDVIEVDVNQFEPLTPTQIPTSPMASTGIARTDWDTLSFPSAGNISGTQGTAYAEVVMPNIVDNNWFLGSSNAALYRAAGKLTLFDGTTNRSGNAFIPSQAVQKIAFSWGGTVSQTALNGVASAALGFDGDMGFSAAALFIASSGSGSQPNGFMRNIRIFPTQFSGAQLAALTA